MKKSILLVLCLVFILSLSSTALAASFNITGLAASDPLWSSQTCPKPAGEIAQGNIQISGNVYQQGTTTKTDFVARMYYQSTEAMNSTILCASGGGGSLPLKSPYNTNQYDGQQFRMKFSHSHSYKVVASGEFWIGEGFSG